MVMKAKRKKMKKRRPKFRSELDKALAGVVTAGVVIPLSFLAIKKGAEVLPAVGRGAESLGRIGG